MKEEDIRYTLEIDSEGYPMFEGMRIDDAKWIKELFTNLNRLDPHDSRSALMTRCSGELCFVSPFSSPLVCQRVESLNTESSRWIFPGEWAQDVLHQTLEVDQWGRLHTWIGSMQLDAVLSSKAQADFLNRLPDSVAAQLHPKPFRASEANVNKTTFWDNCYQEGRDGWDMKSATPVLTKHFQELSFHLPGDGKILVPGCGRAHDAAYLSERGHETWALDFSTEAIEAAKKLYSHLPLLKFLQGDVFSYLQAHSNFFDAIFEHTIFCAIDPQRRDEFVSKIAGALKASGIWFGIFFLRGSPGGPPFGLTQWELQRHIEPYFEILDWKISPYSAKPRRNQELWAVFRKLPL